MYYCSKYGINLTREEIQNHNCFNKPGLKRKKGIPRGCKCKMLYNL